MSLIYISAGARTRCSPWAELRPWLLDGAYPVACWARDPIYGRVRVRSVVLLHAQRGRDNCYQDSAYATPAHARHRGRYLVPSLWTVGPAGWLP